MSQDFLLDWSCLMPSGEWEPRERSANVFEGHTPGDGDEA